MKGKKFFNVSFAFFIGILLLASPIKAQRTKPSGKMTGKGFRSARQSRSTTRSVGRKTNSGSQCRKAVKDNVKDTVRQQGFNRQPKPKNSPVSQNDSADQDNPGYGHVLPDSVGPPWFTHSENFSGKDPSWLHDTQEGSGPWFWQAYNDSDISNLAPGWYVHSTDPDHFPAWFNKENKGPWWAYYLFEPK